MTATSRSPVPTSPLRHLNRDRRVISVMLEVRRDTYCDEGTGAPGPGMDSVRGCIAELVGAAVAARESS